MIPEKEQKRLAAFLQEVLEAEEEQSVEKRLATISDEGVVWFAGQLAKAMGQLNSSPSTRTEAIVAIQGLIREFRNSAHVPHAEDNRNVTTNSLRPHEKARGDNGIYQSERPAEDNPLDACSNITQRVLRFQRHLKGWISSTQFAECHHFHPIRVKEMIMILHKEECMRHAVQHPEASREAQNAHVQKDYIALVGSQDREIAHSEKIWIDLSPRAQQDLLDRCQKTGMIKKHTYKEVLARPGWLPLETFRRKNSVVNITEKRRNELIGFLEAQAKQREKNHMETHGCTHEEASQYVADTYMWVYRSAVVTKRILSPEAQKDGESFLKQILAQPRVKDGVREPNKEISGNGMLGIG